MLKSHKLKHRDKIKTDLHKAKLEIFHLQEMQFLIDVAQSSVETAESSMAQYKDYVRKKIVNKVVLVPRKENVDG